MPSYLIANLDAEVRLCGRELSAALLARISALGSLMRVLALDDQTRLCLDKAIDEKRIAGHDFLPDILIEERKSCKKQNEKTLRWSAVVSSYPDALRKRREYQELIDSTPTTKLTTSEINFDELKSRLWSMKMPSHEVLAMVHDRELATTIAQRLNIGITSIWCETLSEITCALERIETDWLIRVPYSSSGRDMVIGKGKISLSLKTRVERLLRRDRRVLVQPWLNRNDDYGICGCVDDKDVCVVGCYKQVIDASGAFSGVELSRNNRAFINEHYETELKRNFFTVGRYLSAFGYRGAFSVDAFSYQTSKGEQFYSLCEINPRITYGLLAHGYGKALARICDWKKMRFMLGRKIPERVYPLLLPDAPDDHGAWLEVELSAP